MVYRMGNLLHIRRPSLSNIIRRQPLLCGRLRLRAYSSGSQSNHTQTLSACNVYEPPGEECPEWDWDPDWNGDFFCRDAEAELLSMYREGGYHPVHVRDHFQGERYEIMRKLGWGHDGMVWLARDKK